jgi:hypothetical protein
MKLGCSLQLNKEFRFTMVYGVDPFYVLYIVLSLIFLILYDAYIYRCLGSFIYDVIHAKCRNILNLFYSHLEFSFVG